MSTKTILSIFSLFLLVAAFSPLYSQSKMIKRAIAQDNGRHYFVEVNFKEYYLQKKVDKAVSDAGYQIYKSDIGTFDAYGKFKKGYRKILITTPRLLAAYNKRVADERLAYQERQRQKDQDFWEGLLTFTVVAAGVVSALSSSDSDDSNYDSYIPTYINPDIGRWSDWNNTSGTVKFDVKNERSGATKLRNAIIFAQYNKEAEQVRFYVAPPRISGYTNENLTKYYAYDFEQKTLYKTLDLYSSSATALDRDVKSNEYINAAVQHWIQNLKTEKRW